MLDGGDGTEHRAERRVDDPPQPAREGPPKCAKFKESGHGAANGVFINGVVLLLTTSASKLTLVITGLASAAVRRRYADHQ